MRSIHGTTMNRSQAMGLQNLQRSMRWAAPPSSIKSSEALSQRLESLLILELMKDNGGRQFLTMSVRGLYRHVLASITTTNSTTGRRDSVRVGNNKAAARPPSPTSNRKSVVVIGEPLVTPMPIGLAPPALGGGEENMDTRRVSFRNSEPSSPPVGTAPLPLSNNKNPRSGRQRSISINADQNQHLTGGVTYRERLGGYLHPRDMRRLVTPFSASNEPELIVRRHVMLLNFDPLRAIILRDRLLILVPDGADSVLVRLEDRVRGSSEDVETAMFGGKADPLEDSSNHYNSNNSSSKSTAMPMNFVKNLFSGKQHPASTPTDSYSSAEGAEKDALTQDGGAESAIPPPPDNTQVDNDDQDDDDQDDDLEKEWDEMKRNEWVDLPFELQCADAVLHVVCSILSEDTLELQQASLNYIQRLLSDSADDPLTVIRAVKDAVREMSNRVKGFVKSLNRVLNEDEDMALMNLSRLLTHPERFIQPVRPEILEEESDEPELILEAHLQTGLTLINSLDLIQGQIDTAAQLVDQKQDAIRNRILYVNMMLNIGMLCSTLVAVSGSLFGMNLNSHIQEDGNAFYQVVYGSIAGAVALAVLIVGALTWTGTIPSGGFGTGQSSDP